MPTNHPQFGELGIADTPIDLVWNLYERNAAGYANVCPILTRRLSEDFEFQVNVGDEIRRRIPADRNGTPHYVPPGISLDLYDLDLVGITGLDWVNKLTRLVIFDFDDDSHTGGNPRTMRELREVLRRLRLLRYTWARRSKGGVGFHAGVILSHAMPAATGKEHEENARAILERMCRDANFDFNSYADAKGVIGWIYADEIGERGFQVLHRPTRRVPLIERPTEYLWVKTKSSSSSSKAKRTKRVKKPRSEWDWFDRVVNNEVPLDDHHKQMMSWLRAQGWVANWDAEEHRLYTHSKGLAKYHAAHGLPGSFTTISPGKNPHENNCFAHPRRDGAWFVQRYGTPPETDDWEITEEGKRQATLPGPESHDERKSDEEE